MNNANCLNSVHIQPTRRPNNTTFYTEYISCQQITLASIFCFVSPPLPNSRRQLLKLLLLLDRHTGEEIVAKGDCGLMLVVDSVRQHVP